MTGQRKRKKAPRPLAPSRSYAAADSASPFVIDVRAVAGARAPASVWFDLRGGSMMIELPSLSPAAAREVASMFDRAADEADALDAWNGAGVRS